MQHQQRYGISILIVGVLLLVSFWTYFSAVEETLASEATITETGECIHPEGLTCPFERIGTLAPAKYSVLGVSILVVLVGLFMIISSRKTTLEKPRARDTKDLDADEKKLIEALQASSEPLYQGDLVKHLEWSKVKVTRILDRLEAKQFIERKRRGMTNLVILK